MHSIRSAKRYYLAAFLLGALIAVIVAAPVRSSEMPSPGNALPLDVSASTLSGAVQ